MKKKSSHPSGADLHAVRGFKPAHDTVHELTNTAWQFAYSVLWNNDLFSASEKEEAKCHIWIYLTSSPHPTRAFLQFCQRVVLTSQHLSEMNAGVLFLPSIFLDQDNPAGFIRTKDWFDQVREIRHSLPQYKMELKALAEAVLEISEEPSPKIFRYWRNYFMEKKEPVLLELLSVYACNHNFNI